ncbi:MAG: glycerol-3-phosphate 1-O-acyltransferase PlsY [Burkholderiales bacterium]
MANVLLVIFAYALGSIPFAVVISRVFALPDPREYGSKNPGATNVLRSGNKLAALFTLLLDGAKGFVAVWLAQHLHAPDAIVSGAAIAAMLGHLFPLFLRFRGGKGVATSFGAWLALEPLLGVTALLVWVLVALVLRISSAAALASALCAPLVSAIISGMSVTTVTVLLMSALLIVRHASNIRNLLLRSEGKIGEHEE